LGTKKKKILLNLKLLKLSKLKNQIIYQSIELLLELIYKPIFLNSNIYNFHPIKGHYFLLNNLKLNWSKISWILYFQTQNFFSKLNIKRLFNLLSSKIKDNLFLKLTTQFFKIKLKKNFFTVTPIVLNIYLHLLDLEIAKIQKNFNTFNTNLKIIIEYKKNKLKKLRTLSILKYGYIQSYKNQLLLHRIKKKHENNNFQKIQLKYVRCLNYFLLGFCCSKKLIKQIEKQITVFCNSNLKLFILKKKLINFKSNKVDFLNFEIYLKKQLSYLTNKKKNLIFFKVSLKNFKKYLIKYKLISNSNKPKPILWLLAYSNDLILNWFFSLAKFILNYYFYCKNFYKIKIYVNYIIKYSALYTLALKNKCTLNEVIYKWSNHIVIKDQKNNILAKYYT